MKKTILKFASWVVQTDNDPNNNLLSFVTNDIPCLSYISHSFGENREILISNYSSFDIEANEGEEVIVTLHDNNSLRFKTLLFKVTHGVWTFKEI